MTGSIIAFITRGCTFEGPGPSRIRPPVLSSLKNSAKGLFLPIKQSCGLPLGNLTRQQMRFLHYGSWRGAGEPIAEPNRYGIVRSMDPTGTNGTSEAGVVDTSLIEEVRRIVGDEGIVSRPSELKVYECDGWTIEKSRPDLLVLPQTTEEVSAVL